MKYIKNFADIRITDIALVGGKNASLGEMISQLSTQGIRIPSGFAITAQAYWYYLEYNKCVDQMKNLIEQLTGAVRWTQSVQSMIADGATQFTEVGPDKVLQGLVLKINKEMKVDGVS